MSTEKFLTLEQYKKQAFKENYFFFIICVIFEGLSLMAVLFALLGILDRKFLLPAFILFCFCNIGTLITFILFVKKVKGFKKLNPDLKD